MTREKRKRRQSLRRIGSYILMIVAILTLLVIAVFFMQGYRFDASENKIEQYGFVQYDSNIRGAAVSVDAQKSETRTAGKAALPSGSHTFRFYLEKYREWQSTQDIGAGTLTWLNYARFVPENISTESVLNFQKLVSGLTSDDDKKIITQAELAKPEFSLIDISAAQTKTSTITLSGENLGNPAENTAQTFSLEQWNGSSRFVLIKHTFNAADEWIVLDTKDTSFKNISKILAVSIKKIEFGGGNGTIFYAQMADNSLRKIDLGNNTLSAPIATDVKNFSYRRDDRQLIITTNGADQSQTISFYDEDSTKPLVFKTLEKSAGATLIARAHYDNRNYAGLSDGKKVTVYEILPPSTPEETLNIRKISEFSLKNTVTQLHFNQTGRFLMAQSAREVQTFDFFNVTLAAPQTIPEGSGIKKITWIDEFHGYLDDNGSLTMLDFDGQNQQKIAPFSDAFNVTLSQNGIYLYSFVKKEESFSLQRSLMILP